MKKITANTLRLVIINAVLILISTVIYPIVAFYLSLLSGIIFIFSIQSDLIKAGSFKNTFKSKFFFIVTNIILYFGMIYVYLVFDLSSISFTLSAVIGAVLFTMVCYGTSKFTNLRLILTKIIIISALIFFPAHIIYMLDYPSLSMVIWGAAGNLLWQLNAGNIIHEAYTDAFTENSAEPATT